MINVSVRIKSIVRAKEFVVGILAHVLENNSSYLKSIIDDSVIV